TYPPRTLSTGVRRGSSKVTGCRWFGEIISRDTIDADQERDLFRTNERLAGIRLLIWAKSTKAPRCCRVLEGISHQAARVRAQQNVLNDLQIVPVCRSPDNRGRKDFLACGLSGGLENVKISRSINHIGMRHAQYRGSERAIVTHRIVFCRL